MAYGARKRSFKSRASSARKRGRTGYANIVRVSKRARKSAPASRALAGVARLTRMIETKEISRKSGKNVSLAHNNVTIVQDSGTGQDLNVFYCGNGNDDPMSQNTGSRIGDRITVRGVSIKMFLENALSRPKVWYRIMMVKCPRGQAPDRANLFKNDSDNKMIDSVNTEKFTILWQKVFNLQPSNAIAQTATITGEPQQLNAPAGVASKVLTAWIPGRKFFRGGNLQYENATANPKFFDFKLVFVTYDWYGTPQDVNTVGKINELYTKVYFKDA